MRVRFVVTSGVSRGAKRLHKIESSKMLLFFLPFGGRFCAFIQGRGAHVSVIFLPCLPLRAGDRASMWFPRQSRGLYGLSILSLSLSIYLSIYLSVCLSIHITFFPFRSGSPSLPLSCFLSVSLSIYIYIYIYILYIKYHYVP